MATNNEAFTKWYRDRYPIVLTPEQFSIASQAYDFAKSESEKEIAELKEKHINQLAGCSTAAFGYFKDGDSIHPDYDSVALRDVTHLYAKYNDKFNQITELQASNNRLREALIDTNSRFNEMVDVFYKGSTAGDRKRIEANFELLSSTPAQSLAEHDAELIERCAKVCDEYGEGWHVLGDKIREMKGKR